MPSPRLSTRAAALAVAASGAIFSVPAVSSASTVRAAAATTGCTLPVVHDVYDGFHAGGPRRVGPVYPGRGNIRGRQPDEH